MTIEFSIRSFYPTKYRKLNYFPIIHLSYEKYNSCTLLPKIEIGLVGFCFSVSMIKRGLRNCTQLEYMRNYTNKREKVDKNQLKVNVITLQHRGLLTLNFFISNFNN